MLRPLSFSFRVVRIAVVLGLLLSSAPLVAAPQLNPQLNVKLNHALEPNKPVLDFLVSPDGSRIVYRAARTLPPDQDAPPPPAADLFSVPATGGVAVQLNSPATVETESVESYHFSPDGSQVIYLRTTVDATLGNVFELFSVPTDGTVVATTVSGPIPIGTRSPRDFTFEIEQADVEVVFGDGSVRTINYSLHHRSVPERITSITDGSSNTFFFGEQTNNLNQSPLDGSVRRINPDLTSGGVVYDFEITPDGTRAIYRADQNLDGAIELFSVPADGSDAGFRISGPLVAGGDVLEFKVNSTSTRVVYLADQTTNGVAELYSVRANGGSVTKLNGALTGGGGVTDFEFSPDGNLVVYLADQNTDQKFELFAVATSGSVPSPLSSGALSGSVRSFLIHPDGTQVFYVFQTGATGVLQLFSRPLIANGLVLTSSPFSPPVANLPAPDLKFSADGSHLVYLADTGNDGIFEIATIALTPPMTVTSQINAPLVTGGNIRSFAISPDNTRVLYVADQNSVGVFELFSVPIGGGTAERINAPLVLGGSVSAAPQDLQFSPDGRIVYYLADQETDNLTELYAAFDAPTVEFTQDSYVVAEDNTLTPTLAVKRSGNLLASSTVRVGLIGATEGGTAQGGASLGGAGVDFVDSPRDLVFASGELSKTFSIAIKNDGVAEMAETFSMELFEPGQSVLGTPALAEVTILDTAGAPLLDDAAVALLENSANNTQVPVVSAAVGIAAIDVTTYTILSGNTNNAFRIDNSGALFVNNSAALNYEVNRVFALVIEARDELGSLDRAIWTITLQDQNEAPIFLPQTRSVAENSAAGTFVGAKLVAGDPDGDPLTFSASSPHFNITSTGQLSVKTGANIDFETQKQHVVNVTVSDGNGHQVVAAITVNVVDTAEIDSTLPTIAKYSPASAVAGGKEFYLVIGGTNLGTTSVVRWNDSDRKTSFVKGLLYALISAQDIANVTTAKITVFDTATKKVSGAIAFPVTKGTVGIAELTTSPSGAAGSSVGLPTVFYLEWTHTTEAWRAMDEMDLRLIDGEIIPLWVRYQETRDENGADISTIVLLNADGTPAGSGRFGEAKVLENDTVTLNLAHAGFTGSGETGSNILVTIPVIFKSAAVQSDPYTIEMYGVDDLGGEQGPNVMGTWTVSKPSTYLPQMRR